MRKRIPVKNHYLEIQLTASRSLLAMLMITLLVCLLIARLSWLQLYKKDVYSTLSTNNWLDLVPAEPTRGLIYDRNGILLAENIPVFSLEVIPYEVRNLNETLDKLGTIIAFNENELAQFHKQLKQHRRFDEIPLKLRLTEEEVMHFAENQHRFPGVNISARLMRHYPFGESFGHVLGYVGRINTQDLNNIDAANYSASHYIGKLGIEKHYEQQMHGEVGYQQVENDASGQPIRVLKEIKGKPGKNLYLTLDSSLQFIAENALKGHRGAVAIDPANGEVLALVSQPGYDPNLFVTGISQQDYQALQDSPDHPLYNRALRGQYPPGSTLKPFLAIQGLEAGVIEADTEIYDKGWYTTKNSTRRYHDSNYGGHGMVNLNKAIVTSCDIYFYKLAETLGINSMNDMLSQFGYGRLSEIDLDHELPGVLPTPEWKRATKGASWYPGDSINVSIGQGFIQTTPLQLAAATATLANRGIHVTPHLLLGEQLPGDVYHHYQANPQPPIQLSDNQYWESVISAMKNVVTSPRGTGRRYGKKHNYSIAMKTGTAQVVAKRNQDGKDDQASWPEHLRDHHLIIAFAPADHPTLAVAIITENSNMTIDITHALFDYYLGKKTDANRPAQTQIQKAGI